MTGYILSPRGREHGQNKARHAKDYRKAQSPKRDPKENWLRCERGSNTKGSGCQGAFAECQTDQQPGGAKWCELTA